jgi:hypothetical protein
MTERKSTVGMDVYRAARFMGLRNFANGHTALQNIQKSHANDDRLGFLEAMQLVLARSLNLSPNQHEAVMGALARVKHSQGYRHNHDK